MGNDDVDVDESNGELEVVVGPPGVVRRKKAVTTRRKATKRIAVKRKPATRKKTTKREAAKSKPATRKKTTKREAAKSKPAKRTKATKRKAAWGNGRTFGAGSMRLVTEKQAMEIPEHYLYLERYVEKLLDRGSFEKNVFLMVRYGSSPQLTQVRQTLVQTLRDLDLNPLIASDRAVHTQLWDNICVYMLASKYGIAVFEQIETRDYNPNIAVELGFMTALGRRCLPLKDTRMAALPVDIGSLIYKEFDSYNMPNTVAAALIEWVDRDLELSDSFLEKLLGTYSSQWGVAGSWTNMGTAVVTGSGNEVNVVLRDEQASTYTAKLRPAASRRVRATWVNVDFPDDHGTWAGEVSADFNTIEGRWESGEGSASGVWRLVRVS